MKVTPEILRTSKDIRDMLWPFDFVVVDNGEYGPVCSMPRHWSRSRSWRREALAAYTR
jgi:hypothetical protein